MASRFNGTAGPWRGIQVPPDAGSSEPSRRRMRYTINSEPSRPPGLARLLGDPAQAGAGRRVRLLDGPIGLEEAHRLWHRAAESYEDPEEFRMQLNALIQALRNVTFVLQKEKLKIQDFDRW